MARNWQPKFKAWCECGWTGERTRFNTYKPCPKCGGRADGERVQEHNHRKLTKRVDALLAKAEALRKELQELAEWSENNLYAPDRLGSLMAARDSAVDIVDALMCEASPQASDSISID